MCPIIVVGQNQVPLRLLVVGRKWTPNGDQGVEGLRENKIKPLWTENSSVSESNGKRGPAKRTTFHHD